MTRTMRVAHFSHPLTAGPIKLAESIVLRIVENELQGKPPADTIRPEDSVSIMGLSVTSSRYEILEEDVLQQKIMEIQAILEARQLAKEEKSALKPQPLNPQKRQLVRNEDPVHLRELLNSVSR